MDERQKMMVKKVAQKFSIKINNDFIQSSSKKQEKFHMKNDGGESTTDWG